jgi:hypothetical protein
MVRWSPAFLCLRHSRDIPYSYLARMPSSAAMNNRRPQFNGQRIRRLYLGMPSSSMAPLSGCSCPPYLDALLFSPPGDFISDCSPPARRRSRSFLQHAYAVLLVSAMRLCCSSQVSTMSGRSAGVFVCFSFIYIYTNRRPSQQISSA